MAVQVRGLDILAKLRTTRRPEDGGEVVAVRCAVLGEGDEAEDDACGGEEDGDAVGKPEFPGRVNVDEFVGWEGDLDWAGCGGRLVAWSVVLA